MMTNGWSDGDLAARGGLTVRRKRCDAEMRWERERQNGSRGLHKLAGSGTRFASPVAL